MCGFDSSQRGYDLMGRTHPVKCIDGRGSCLPLLRSATSRDACWCGTVRAPPLYVTAIRMAPLPGAAAAAAVADGAAADAAPTPPAIPPAAAPTPPTPTAPATATAAAVAETAVAAVSDVSPDVGATGTAPAATPAPAPGDNIDDPADHDDGPAEPAAAAAATPSSAGFAGADLCIMHAHNRTHATHAGNATRRTHRRTCGQIHTARKSTQKHAQARGSHHTEQEEGRGKDGVVRRRCVATHTRPTPPKICEKTQRGPMPPPLSTAPTTSLHSCHTLIPVGDPHSSSSPYRRKHQRNNIDRHRRRGRGRPRPKRQQRRRRQ